MQSPGANFLLGKLNRRRQQLQRSDIENQLFDAPIALAHERDVIHRGSAATWWRRQDFLGDGLGQRGAAGLGQVNDALDQREHKTQLRYCLIVALL